MINANFLDEAYARLLQQDSHKGMDLVFRGLKEQHSASLQREWRNFVTSEVLTHPINAAAPVFLDTILG